MTPSRLIRVFISSTFRDFTEERDALVKRVFPELRRRCRERFVELVEVDLRWGITEEEAERGAVLPICLEEIERCRPFFIGLLGERYGWVPDAGQYSAAIVEAQPWLKSLLGGKSVTELEILHGVLNNRQMGGRAFFYFRDPDYSRRGGAGYMSEEEPNRSRLNSLKERIRASGFPVREDYQTPESVAQLVLTDLWQAIDEAYPATAIPDALERQRSEHEAFARSRRGLYLGGEASFACLNSWMEQDDRAGSNPIAVHGASGSGKSALLANWVAEFRRSHPKDLIFEHYLGSSAGSADIDGMLRRLLGEIKRITGQSEVVPTDPAKLRESLPSWLASVSSWCVDQSNRCLILLDGLDHVRDRGDLEWLPKHWPRGLRLLAGTAPGNELDAWRCRNWGELAVEPLQPVLRRQFIRNSLAKYRKSLAPTQIERIASHRLSEVPLFLKVLLDELRVSGTFEELDSMVNWYLRSQSVGDLYELMLERLEKDHGRGLVEATMTCLRMSRAGLTESELLELLVSESEKAAGVTRLPRALWSPLFVAFGEALTEETGRLSFFHKDLGIAVTDRYLRSPASAKFVRKRLADFFMAQDFPRKFEEGAYQMALLEDWESLATMLVKNPKLPLAIGIDAMEVAKIWKLTALHIAFADRFKSETTAQRDTLHEKLAQKWTELAYQIGDLDFEKWWLEQWRLLAPKISKELARSLASLEHRTGNVGKACDILKAQLAGGGDFDLETDALMYMALNGRYREVEVLAARLDAEYAGLLAEDSLKRAAYLHVKYFAQHELEMNLDAVAATRAMRTAYRNHFRAYDETISTVNLGDALWGTGRMEEAEELLRLALRNGRDSGLDQVVNIAAICLANVLASVGRKDEASDLYREGVKLSIEIGHQWDVLYGQAHLALHQIESGLAADSTALLEIRSLAAHAGFSYIESLASSQICIASFSVRIADDILDAAITESVNSRYPGARVYGWAAKMRHQLASTSAVSAGDVQHWVDSLRAVQGVKGRSGIVAVVAGWLTTADAFSSAQAGLVNEWLDCYVPQMNIPFYRSIYPAPRHA